MRKKPDPADIEIIATGGNFEKRFEVADEAALYTDATGSQSEKMLAEALGPTAAIQTVFLKDSSKMSDEDRRTICEAARLSPLPRIVILHGTSTLDVTTRFLFQMNLKKTIVLTGTTANFEDRPSEAYFNLGTAIGLVQALPFGVYPVMNGRILRPMSLRKDSNTGRFDTASGEHLLNATDRR